MQLLINTFLFKCPSGPVSIQVPRLSSKVQMLRSTMFKCYNLRFGSMYMNDPHTQFLLSPLAIFFSAFPNFSILQQSQALEGSSGHLCTHAQWMSPDAWRFKFQHLNAVLRYLYTWPWIYITFECLVNTIHMHVKQYVYQYYLPTHYGSM